MELVIFIQNEQNFQNGQNWEIGKGWWRNVNACFVVLSLTFA